MRPYWLLHNTEMRLAQRRRARARQVIINDARDDLQLLGVPAVQHLQLVRGVVERQAEVVPDVGREVALPDVLDGDVERVAHDAQHLAVVALVRL